MRNDWVVREYGSEFPLEDGRGDPLRDGDRRAYLRSGRDALRLVAEMLAAQGCTYAILPCYCCESMEWPFLDAGMEVVYYAVGEGLQTDLEDMKRRAAEHPESALLHMGYFGLPDVDAHELAKLKGERSLWLIRDATHDWLDKPPEDGGSDDFCIVSLRKWAGIPDGGLVFSRGLSILPAPVTERGGYAQLREEAMGMKAEYMRTGNAALKSAYLEKLGKCNDLLDSLHETEGMSETSRAIAASVDWYEVARARRENASIIAAGLKGMGIEHYYREGTSPLWMPFVPRCDRDALQITLNRLGLYCPYLWPIPPSACGCSAFVDDFVGRMLCLPCDQRFDAKDAKRMLALLEKGLKEVGVL